MDSQVKSFQMRNCKEMGIKCISNQSENAQCLEAR